MTGQEKYFYQCNFTQVLDTIQSNLNDSTLVAHISELFSKLRSYHSTNIPEIPFYVPMHYKTNESV